MPRREPPQPVPAGERRWSAIDGVVLRETSPIPTRNGTTIELFSSPWLDGDAVVRHAIHVRLDPGAVSAWHMHDSQTDHLMPVEGAIEVVVHDRRPGSTSRGRTECHELAAASPLLIRIPPGVWHGIRNLRDHDPSAFVNLFDRPYQHGQPDEWRLPVDTDLIPHAFPTAVG